MRFAFRRLFCGVCLVLLPVLAQASGFEAGLRGGFDAAGNEENFSLIEATLQKTYGWQKELGVGVFKTRWNASLGYLEASGEGAALLSAGGDLVYEMADGLLALDVGFRPMLLSEHSFDEEDLGGPLQFGSHAGVALAIDRFVLSYRFEHISNAGIYSRNPGVNMHMIGLGARF
ncbi:MAG: acyloxyacyl hydrolase [Deltaproteobacteria bacterium]|nr:MAG: acyloxyacyl hydrolase [Deltaproteobacteria bacterium]